MFMPLYIEICKTIQSVIWHRVSKVTGTLEKGAPVEL